MSEFATGNVGQQHAIVVRDLHKAYQNSQSAHRALDGVTLYLKRGEIHGILGASGAGKTTLLRCLLRLEQADGGNILLEGQDWSILSKKVLRRERRRVGVIFQHLHLLASRTVEENVALPLELAGISRDVRLKRVKELLSWFSIADKAQAYPARLSGGQKQRVALARALATNPSILLADEPTSALDAETKRSVLTILQQIRNEFGVTILLITHDLRAAAFVCDTLSILEAGRIVDSGSVEEISLKPRTEAARQLFAEESEPIPASVLRSAKPPESELWS
jgi:D-methionine transport system ATP-binding protein